MAKYKLKRSNINKPFVHLFEKNYHPNKFNIFYGGTGSGKSVALSRFFVMMALKFKGSNWLMLRKIYADMPKTIIDEFIGTDGALSYFKLVKDIDYTYNKSDKILHLVNGSKIIFSGYDDPEKLKGIKNLWGTWMEEATDFSSEDIGLLRDRMRGDLPKNYPWKFRPIFMSYNPTFITHWIRKLFFKEEIDKSDKIWIDTVKNSKLCTAIKVTWRDNMYYGKENYADKDYREHKHSHNKRLAEVEDYGNWGVLGELIYENVKVMDIADIEEKYNLNLISWGLDFGFKHKTGMCKVAYDIENNTLIILDELYQEKLTVTDLYKAIIDKFGYMQWDIYCDCARPEMISELNEKGLECLPSKKGAGSVLDGIEWIKDKDIVVASHCYGHITEFNIYQWKKDKRTGDTLPVPIKENDDAMDAFRYATQEFKELATGWY